MKLPSLTKILVLLDHSDESLVFSNMEGLREEFGLSALVDLYVKAFYKLKNYPGRRDIAYWIGRYVHLNDNVFDMAKYGLSDRSYIVRYHCCKILAFAQKEDDIYELKKYTDHKHRATREDITAVIDSIKCKNHNYFVDREHTGKIFFEMGKI